MGAWGNRQFENDAALNVLDEHLNPLVFSLYEMVLWSAIDPDYGVARAVALAEIVSAVGLRCPQSSLSREEAARWRDRIFTVLESKVNWSVESRQATMSTFDLLVSTGCFQEETEESEFRSRYERWCVANSREPMTAAQNLPNTAAQTTASPSSGL